MHIICVFSVFFCLFVLFEVKLSRWLPKFSSLILQSRPQSKCMRKINSWKAGCCVCSRFHFLRHGTFPDGTCAGDTPFVWWGRGGRLDVLLRQHRCSFHCRPVCTGEPESPKLSRKGPQRTQSSHVSISKYPDLSVFEEESRFLRLFCSHQKDW